VEKQHFSVGTLLAIFSTAEPDISDLTPISKKIGDDLILNWPDLERHPHALDAAPSAFAGARVQALGYMMEGDRGRREHGVTRAAVLSVSAATAQPFSPLR
jgi:hypothetical protein